MSQSQEYLKREFMHHLVNVVALLGGTPEFIDTIKQVEEKPFTSQSIEALKRYACEQHEGLKDRINRCYTTIINVKD